MFLICQSSKNILDYQKSRYKAFFRNLIVKLILDLSQFNIINLNFCSNIKIFLQNILQFKYCHFFNSGNNTCFKKHDLQFNLCNSSAKILLI